VDVCPKLDASRQAGGLVGLVPEVVFGARDGKRPIRRGPEPAVPSRAGSVRGWTGGPKGADSYRTVIGEVSTAGSVVTATIARSERGMPKATGLIPARTT
jgi:hypothetical protein